MPLEKLLIFQKHSLNDQVVKEGTIEFFNEGTGETKH